MKMNEMKSARKSSRSMSDTIITCHGGVADGLWTNRQFSVLIKEGSSYPDGMTAREPCLIMNSVEGTEHWMRSREK